MFELSFPGGKIWAVPYRGRRALKPVHLPEGAIVEELARMHQESGEVDPLFRRLPLYDFGIPMFLEVDSNGNVNTDQFNEDIAFLPTNGKGVYLLPNGKPGAVYGGKATPIGD